MTEQRSFGRANRVHVPIEGAGTTGDPSLGRLLEAHPGVVRASVGKTGRLLIVDYDPALIGLPDVASIVRLAGYRVASGPG